MKIHGKKHHKCVISIAWTLAMIRWVECVAVICQLSSVSTRCSIYMYDEQIKTNSVLHYYGEA